VTAHARARRRRPQLAPIRAAAVPATPPASLAVAPAVAPPLGAAVLQAQVGARPVVRGPLEPRLAKAYKPLPPADAQPKDDSEQRTPRPKGVASGFPWSPRESIRKYTTAKFIAESVEWLDAHPAIQPIGAWLSRVAASLRPRDDGTPGAPVANDPPGAWKFSAIGDYGAGTDAEAKVARNVDAGHPELIVTVGDNVYPTGRWQDYVKNFDPYFGDIARRIPFMPSMGNHDLYRDDATPYFAHFAQLKGLPYYTFEHKDAQFWAIDGDEDMRPGSPQYTWLDHELAASTSRWKVVYLHYPLWATGGAEEFTELREALQPLMVKYGVQLCITGHEHTYERNQAIDGVTNILTGGAGQQVWDFLKPREPYTAFRAPVNHHVEFSVGHDAIVVRTIDAGGKLIDTATIPWHGPAQAAAGAASVSGAASRARPASAKARARRGH
jgi:hypothetical protein